LIDKNLDTPDWQDVLKDGEELLWSGRPEYGRKFMQFVGQEKIFYGSFVVGIVAIWISFLFIEPDGRHNRTEAAWIFSALSIGFVAGFYYMAATRSYVLSNLFYAITDQRAIVCRKGKNFRLSNRRYFLSFPYLATYSFPIFSGHPLSSIQVGSLLSEEIVQPFGHGLTHPGWPVGQARGVIPVLFENIEDLQPCLHRLDRCNPSKQITFVLTALPVRRGVSRPKKPAQAAHQSPQSAHHHSSATSAMVEVEGENMRPVTWVRVKEVRSRHWGMGGNTPSTEDVKAMAAG